MYRLLQAAIAVALIGLWPRLSAAQEGALTLDGALRLARQRAPAVLSAGARVEEARGRLTGAAVLLQNNPLVQTSLGHRTSERGDYFDADLALTQVFELGGQRGARVRAAEAGVDRTRAASDDVTRRLLRDVAVAFLRSLYVEQRLRLATHTETLAEEIVRISERRRTAGDAADLDVNIARTALARARSETRAAEAEREASLGDLRLLLGLGTDEPLAVAGDLADRRRYELQALMARAPERADLRALVAGEREADAERRLGEGLAWPDLGLGVRYEREEGANAILGTLTLTLPVFNHGQGLRAESAARARRVRLELDAGQRVVSVEVRTAFAVYGRRVAAVEEIEREALTALDETERRSQRAYESGQISLTDMLLLRREMLETRRSHLERLLEAAVAGVELEAAAGVLR